LLHVADGVRRLFRHAFLNHATGRVRNLARMAFLHIPRAADLTRFDARAPHLAAADRRRALNLFRPAATGLVAAAAGAGVPFPGAGVLNAAAHHRAGDRFFHRLPVAGAARNGFRFANRTAGRVAAFLVACLIDRLADRVAAVAVASLVNRLANRVAAFFVAGLVSGTADGVAAVTIARFVDRPADRIAFVTIARRIDGATRLVAAVAIARLIHRLAHGVALVAIAGIVNRFAAGDGHRFAAGVVHRLTARIGLLLPDRFTNGLVAGLTTASRLTIISRRCGARGRARRVARSSAIARLGGSARGCHQEHSGKQAISKDGLHGDVSSPLATQGLI
jgi:hypothetical protein